MSDEQNTPPYPDPEAHDYGLKTYQPIIPVLETHLSRIETAQILVGLETLRADGEEAAQRRAYLDRLEREEKRIQKALEVAKTVTEP